MDIKANLTVAEADAEKIAAKLRADALEAEAAALSAQNWIQRNWHAALAIAVGLLILGVSLAIHFKK